MQALKCAEVQKMNQVGWSPPLTQGHVFLVDLIDALSQSWLLLGFHGTPASFMPALQLERATWLHPDSYCMSHSCALDLAPQFNSLKLGRMHCMRNVPIPDSQTLRRCDSVR